MEWFSDRGVSYEHNMHVLDRHIANLAKANTPSQRQPYSGQVRFASNIIDDRGLDRSIEEMLLNIDMKNDT